MKSTVGWWSDAAIFATPILVGMGLSGLLTPAYKQCGPRPRLQPPDLVFPIAWTLLYLLFGASAAIAWRANGRRASPALYAAGALLIGLFLWGVVFFNVCAPAAAFFAILLLLGGALASALLYSAEGRTLSFALSLPLVAWLSFASYLSYTSIP